MKFEYGYSFVINGDLDNLLLMLKTVSVTMEQTKSFLFFEQFLEGIFEEKALKFSSFDVKLQFKIAATTVNFFEQLFNDLKFGNCKICLSIIRYFIECRNCDNFPEESRSDSSANFQQEAQCINIDSIFNHVLKLLEITFDGLYLINDKVKNEFFMKLFFLMPTKTTYTKASSVVNLLDLGSMILKFSPIRRSDIAKLIDKCIILQVDNVDLEIFDAYLKYLVNSCIFVDFDIFFIKLKQITQDFFGTFLSNESILRSKNVCPIFFQTLAKEKSDWITQETLSQKISHQNHLAKALKIILLCLKELIITFVNFNIVQIPKFFNLIWTSALDNSSMLYSEIKALAIEIYFEFVKSVFLLINNASSEYCFEDDFEIESKQITKTVVSNFLSNEFLPVVQKIIPIRQKPISSKIQIIDEIYRIPYESWIRAIECSVLGISVYSDTENMDAQMKMYGIDSVWIQKNVDYYDSRLVCYYFYYYLFLYTPSLMISYEKSLLEILILLLVERKTNIAIDFLTNISPKLVEAFSVDAFEEKKFDYFVLFIQKLVSKTIEKKEINEFFNTFTFIIKNNIKEGFVKNDSGIKYLNDAYHFMGSLIEKFSDFLYEPQSTRCTLPILLAEFFTFSPHSTIFIGISYPEFSLLLVSLCKKFTPHVLNALLKLDWTKDLFVKKQFIASLENYIFNLNDLFYYVDAFVSFKHDPSSIEKFVNFVFKFCIECNKSKNFSLERRLLSISFSILRFNFNQSVMWYEKYMECSSSWMNYILENCFTRQKSFNFFSNLSLDYFFSLAEMLLLVNSCEDIFDCIYNISLDVLFGIIIELFSVPIEFEYQKEVESYFDETSLVTDLRLHVESINMDNNQFHITDLYLRICDKIFSFWRILFSVAKNKTKLNIKKNADILFSFIQTNNLSNHHIRISLKNYLYTVVFSAEKSLSYFNSEIFI